MTPAQALAEALPGWQHPEAAIAGAVTEARAHLRGLLALLPPEPLEWEDGVVGERAMCGLFVLTAGDGGWALKIKVPLGSVSGDLVDLGPETGPAGKAAAEAAYRKAAGL